MACFTNGMLRAHLDGELSPAQSERIRQHCAVCEDCGRRAVEIAETAEEVRTRISSLQQPQSEAMSNARAALASFRMKHPYPSRLGLWPIAFFSRRSMWAAATAIAAVVFTFSFAPARSWAQRLVGMLRVQQITAISLDFDDLEHRDERNQMLKAIAQLTSDNLVVTMKPGKPQTVETRAQASELAGFSVRLPQQWGETARLRVLGAQAFYATIDRDRLQSILEEAGRSDLQLPAALDGATIAAQLPKIVFAEDGECSRSGARFNCTVLAQAPSPTVTVPPELNVAELAEVALQLGGMTAEAARGFSRSIDWTSTLVLGLPRGTSWRSVEVDGVQGTLIEGSTKHRRDPRYSLLWVKNGIIYALMITGNADDALTLAGSLN